MRILNTQLKSVSSYSQSKHYDVPKLDRELPKDYEARTWRERMHVNNEGYVFIPPMSFKNCLSEAASFLSIKIPGKRNATYTKHFEAGVLVIDPIILPFKKETVQGEWFFVPSDGKRGGSSRVDKCFPVIPSWEGSVNFYIADEIITKNVFQQHIDAAGKFIGLGRFRPRKNGFYGRFSVVSISEQVESLAT